MFQNPEQFAAATKAMFEFQLETFNTLTNRAVQGLEQVVALNMATARSSLESGLAAGREFSQAGSPKAAMDAASSKLQPHLSGAVSYNQQLGQILSDLQKEFNDAAEAHMKEAKSNLSALIYDVTKNVPPGSENAVEIVKQAIDNAYKGYEQVTAATRQAVVIFESQVAKARAMAEAQATKQ